MIMVEVNRGLGRCDSCQGVRQSSGRCERYQKCLLVLWRGVMVMWEV